MKPTTCEFDPVQYKDSPIGMFHCPLCGEMVLAGLSHPGIMEQEDWDAMDAMETGEMDLPDFGSNL